MRNHELCENFMEASIRNITERNEGPISFATIVKPEPRIFPREGGCTVRMLYPQRFMTWTMPKLLEKFETASESGETKVINDVQKLMRTITEEEIMEATSWDSNKIILAEKIALSSAICLTLHEVSLEIAEKFIPQVR